MNIKEYMKQQIQKRLTTTDFDLYESFNIDRSVSYGSDSPNYINKRFLSEVNEIVTFHKITPSAYLVVGIVVKRNTIETFFGTKMGEPPKSIEEFDLNPKDAQLSFMIFPTVIRIIIDFLNQNKNIKFVEFESYQGNSKLDSLYSRLSRSEVFLDKLYRESGFRFFKSFGKRFVYLRESLV